MRRLLSFILLLAIVSRSVDHAAGEDSEAGGAELSASYYPLAIGTQWEYQIGSVQATMRVVKHERVGQVTCGLIESSVDGKIVATEHISAGETGIFRHKFNGMMSSAPVCILKLPVATGQTWKFDAKIANETVKGSFQSGEEDVTVPAGKFKTVTAYTTECDLNGNKAEFKYWFAPGVGVVRQTINLGGREIVTELKEFKAEK